VLLVGREFNAPQLKWNISRLTVFAGSRTHATIAALSSGVPTLCIGYSLKARGISKDLFGHLDWLLPLESMTPETLADRLGRMLAQAPSLRAHLQAVAPGYVERAWAAGRYVREAIEANRHR
jgi:polysaccharide pyruvyl transferase WcaK-like protein